MTGTIRRDTVRFKVNRTLAARFQYDYGRGEIHTYMATEYVPPAGIGGKGVPAPLGRGVVCHGVWSYSTTLAH